MVCKFFPPKYDYFKYSDFQLLSRIFTNMIQFCMLNFVLNIKIKKNIYVNYISDMSKILLILHNYASLKRSNLNIYIYSLECIHIFLLFVSITLILTILLSY